RAQTGHRAGQTNASRAPCRCSQNHRRCRVEELAFVVFADSENIQTDLVRLLDALEQLAHAVYRAGCQAGVVEPGGEAINSYFHLCLPCIRGRRILSDGLELDFDRGSVAHEDAASLERHIPVQTEVLPIELCHRCKASDCLAEWVGANAVKRDIKRDLAGLSADREIAGDLESVPVRQ